MILYEHFVKTRRLDLLQLLQTLRLEGDLAVEIKQIITNHHLLFIRGILYRKVYKHVLIQMLYSAASSIFINIIHQIWSF